MTKAKRIVKEQPKPKISPFKDYWDKHNYLLLITGLIVLVIGYILMAQNPWYNFISLSVSPVVLLLAYVIIIPLSIIITKKKSKNNNDIS
ncbi:MAG: hypothetical protein QHH13_01440 [Melioribacter sp.]|uniref:hypothetical protein n=1 Tax=Rosettibacter primus TaxID=3111523 RepID=UPI00247CD8A4|nr:hypothetical protein [Melioribacter sp.]